MDTWLGDEEAEADKRLQEGGSSGTETAETAAVGSGKRPSAERFVRVVGRCTVPGFYSRVASRGLTRSLLTSEDLIKQYLKHEEEDTGAQVAAPQATMNLPEQLAEMLFKALLQGDDAMLRALARQAVMRYAGMEPGRPVGGT